MIRTTDSGLYCEAGDFFVDPWAPVDRAVITHAHGDHARPGSTAYLTAAAGVRVLEARLGRRVEGSPYGQAVRIGDATVSFHPAGHILGSAQVRVEVAGEVWVISGDYKLAPDPTCEPFEFVRSHTFVTESTFGLPIYRWEPTDTVARDIAAWWRANQAAGKATLLYGYILGKSQRLLALLDPDIGPIYTHGAVENVTRVYRASGVSLPPTVWAGSAPPRTDWSRAMILAPPSAHGTPWMRRFGTVSTGLASGWMRIRGTRRRRAIDRGFAMSDHVDWEALTGAVRDSGAERVLVTHGYVTSFVRWLREAGYDAAPLATPYEGEAESGGAADEAQPGEGVADEAEPVP